MTGPIRAAGVVLWRGEHTGEVEIGLVHRPRYDDWTHPKGKLDPDEQVLLGAARETREEAGSEIVVGAFLGSVGYQVATADGRHTDKTVDYFSARSVGGTFVPGEEVDELRWVAPERALK
jgi:8-oxo-dGTP diphosphatase